MDVSPENEAAASLAWLLRELQPAADQSSPTQVAWHQVRDKMRRPSDQIVGSLQDWVSDFWLCKGSQLSFVGAAPAWNPPDALAEWPLLDWVPRVATGIVGGRPTNFQAFSRLLAGGAPAEPSSDAVIGEFSALDDASVRQADIPMHQAQHVRAWLGTAFGNLLMSIALSPQRAYDELVAETHRRLLIPRWLNITPTWGVPFSEGDLAILYNCRQRPGNLLRFRGMRAGQGDEWMKHWQWLSQPLPAWHTLAALQLAARLMRCRPLLDALLSCVQSDDLGLVELAVGVLRRWMLSLEAMAWLEHALPQTWRFIRSQDLCCFAFNAVKPEWPHRLIALSHRSMDVKTVLEGSHLWGSHLFAIDAHYVPSWETNTGMVWGLFAATPVVVRIQSEHYDASEWCRREAELLQHLVESCDFLSRRVVTDLAPDRIQDLETFVDLWRAGQSQPGSPLGLEFPPLCSVYAPRPVEEWMLRILRAAGALRVLRAVYQSTVVANGICLELQSSDREPPVPPPTNNPDGWQAYRQVFRELQADYASTSAQTPLAFAPDAPDPDPEVADGWADAIPDLSRGTPSIRDVLAALEWQTTLLPIAEEANIGDTVVIDLRDITREIWASHPEFALHRGIAALRSPARPIWFIQNAGQLAETWDLPADHPIFTQYTERQFAWMMEFSVDPWPGIYAQRCGLTICDELRDRCRQAV